MLLSCDADLAARNDSGNRSSIQAMLAYTHALLGEPAPALECLRWLDELNSPELFNYVFAERARSRLALDDGEAVAAERWARSAVGHGPPPIGSSCRLTPGSTSRASYRRWAGTIRRPPRLEPRSICSGPRARFQGNGVHECCSGQSPQCRYGDNPTPKANRADCFA